ncbi:MAG: PEP/pyruvate-binding domain-containing protein [Candidatus Micrarchaeia archaeon]
MLQQIIVPPSRYNVRKLGKFLIVGNGSIGGKALEGFQKQDKIAKSGMLWPETVAFATDFFDGLVRSAERVGRIPEHDEEERLLRAHLETSLLRSRLRGIDHRTVEEALSFVERQPSAWHLQNAIRETSIGKKEMEILTAILEQWGAKFYVARSSHLSERGGNGKYFSDFGAKDGIIGIMKHVVASSADGQMAVMLQSLAVDAHEGTATKYYPIAGGCAYTTRIRDGSGKIKIALGLGTKVVRDGAETYFFKNGKLERTEEDPTYGMADVLTNSELDRFELTRMMMGSTEMAILERAKTGILKALVEILKKLEHECGRPQYVEFAATKEGIYCVQICDTETLETIPEDAFRGNIIATGKYMNGMRRIKVTDVVFLNGKKEQRELDLDGLERLNQRVNEYMFVVGSGAFSKFKGYDKLDERHISNANAVLVCRTDKNGDSEHYGEQTAGNHVMERFGTGFPWLVVDKTPEFLWPHEMKGVTHLKLERPMEFYVNEAVGKGTLTEL